MFVVPNCVLLLLLFPVMRLATETLPKNCCFPSPDLSLDLGLVKSHDPAEQGGAGPPAVAAPKVRTLIVFVLQRRKLRFQEL